ncbi:MAG: Holliday junction branch migration protein RuvA [Peptostreptococcaceae bacterium]|nr:Holliday junction branch migration protein RuvA [Peptostreptococcaceae bacterium]MDY5738886.1 Holliday junction branch migration protein RuvA [Anaerovoracaceae bacterium]
MSMIRFLKGKFHPSINGSAIIETVSGIGFEVFIADNSPLYKTIEGEDVKIHTSMIVKEDSMTLYGFHDRDSLEMFEMLITVNGVGPKAAMSIMSAFPLFELKNAIAGGDSKAIAKANGIGKKTSERIIIDLKDKVSGSQDGAIDISYDVSISPGSERHEAVAALLALGYNKTEADLAVGKIPEDNLSAEEYIKKALKNLF